MSTNKVVVAIVVGVAMFFGGFIYALADSNNEAEVACREVKVLRDDLVEVLEKLRFRAINNPTTKVDPERVRVGYQLIIDGISQSHCHS